MIIITIGSGDFCLDQEEEAVAKGVRGVMQVTVIINIVVISNIITVMTLIVISINIAVVSHSCNAMQSE